MNKFKFTKTILAVLTATSSLTWAKSSVAPGPTEEAPVEIGAPGLYLKLQHLRPLCHCQVLR